MTDLKKSKAQHKAREKKKTIMSFFLLKLLCQGCSAKCIARRKNVDKKHHNTHSSASVKGLFNNVSTFKNMCCIALHAISVFHKV